MEDSCRLLVTHSELREGANEELYGGWPMILSGLKTWLETGEKLTTPGSLMHTEHRFQKRRADENGLGSMWSGGSPGGRPEERA